MKLLGNGKLTAEFDTDCGATREILNRVGDKWSVLVVVLLGEGTMRFNQIRRAVDGISQRMLTSTLRGLERDGLAKRTVRPTTSELRLPITPSGGVFCVGGGDCGDGQFSDPPRSAGSGSQHHVLRNMPGPNTQPR